MTYIDKAVESVQSQNFKSVSAKKTTADLTAIHNHVRQPTSIKIELKFDTFKGFNLRKIRMADLHG